ncbi:hypothetical protein Acr_05g0010340 [Actinidia rufa]|uniref:Reverse transcriptase domain-containing protein n=1 Tax=Actinidia rufa TaxID=165716 RepID=A0A7J0ELP6_9ERIC|nr:hypothetical protein Acr_05g0010340 [Actinidia rufa]
MHLRNHYLPRLSASSPPDNRAPPMANTSQDPDLEGLHRKIHAPPIPDIERSHHSNRSGGRSQNLSTDRAQRGRRRSPSPPRCERSSLSESSEVPAVGGKEMGRGRSPRRGDRIGAREKSTSQKIRDLDARLDAINTGTNAPVIVDTLIRQIEPPFTERVLRARVSSRFKLPTQLGIYEGKTDPMNHLDLYKSLMLLQGCSDEVMCKAFSATLKGAESTEKRFPPLHRSPEENRELERLRKTIQLDCIRSRGSQRQISNHGNDGRTPTWSTIRLLFQKCSRNFVYHPESKADKCPRTPPRRPEFILPPLNAPVAQVLSKIKHEEFIKWPGKIKTDPQKRNQNKYCEFNQDHRHNTEDCFQLKEQIADLIKRGYLRKYVATRLPPNSLEERYGDNRPTAGDIQTIHSGFGSGGCSTSSRKRHARSAHRPADEEIYNLSSVCVGDHPPITFSNDDLRGLHLPHDDALVVSAVIANFNVQIILIDNGSSADILFISAFERMKIGLDKLHPFHTPLIGFGGNMTHPLGWINLPITLGVEPHQTTV